MDPLLWGWVALGLILLLVIIIWSIRRHQDPILQVKSEASIEDLIPSLSGLTLSTALSGNQVIVHENGAFYDVLLEHIGRAQRSVHFETYLWKQGVLGQRVADALSERARANTQVRVLVDSQGSRTSMGKAVQLQMQQAGCRLVYFHKRSLRNLGVLNDRDHRKLVVIDGREAFVGGHCIVDDWLGNAEDGHVADVSLELHGPIVHSVQAAFSENWAGETGEMFVGDAVFPRLERAGDALIHAVFLKPEGSAPTVKILHHVAICLARKRIWIQNPYFIPEPEAIDALGEAVKRGVDVRVMMPSTSGSDNPIVQHAGHRNFEKLLRCGVRLFEYPHTLLHQKIMTIDGVWSAVGSSNFDDRSFETNDEITLAILDAGLARQLDAIFEKYALRCQEVELETWRRRSIWHKLADNAFYMVNEVL